MLHPNKRRAVTRAMTKLLLAHKNVDEVLDFVAEHLSVPKKFAAELVPKDSSEESRQCLSLFIAAEITTMLNKGLPTDNCVRAGLMRFDVQAPQETFNKMVRSFDAERNRLAKLRPGEHDNGVGGTMEIVNSSGEALHVGKPLAN